MSLAWVAVGYLLRTRVITIILFEGEASRRVQIIGPPELRVYLPSSGSDQLAFRSFKSRPDNNPYLIPCSTKFCDTIVLG